MKTHKILVVEDQCVVRADIVAELIRLGIPTTAILEADSLQDAMDLFLTWESSIVAICLDGCLHATTLNTIPLIELCKPHDYKGILIAMSSDASLRQKMMQAGCTHEATSKDYVAETVFDLLEVGD